VSSSSESSEASESPDDELSPSLSVSAEVLAAGALFTLAVAVG
jgi:hypothetical protein